MGPLWTGLISTWLSLAGSRHSLTLPLSFGTCTMLLHHSASPSLPNGVIISCYWSLSNSSLNSFWSADAIHHGGARFCLLFSFTCNENVPSKCPIPVITSLNSLCSCFVILVLVLSLSLLGL